MWDERQNLKAAPAPRRHRVTSFDVAAEAGVSQSTVSRALAGDPVVSEATRSRVFAAARKLDYHVDENAARLRTGRTGTIAVVVIMRPGDHIRDFNPFYFALLGATCAAASRRGYETLVSLQHGPENLFGRYQEQRKADGLIVIGASVNVAAWEYFEDVAASGAHVVCWGSPREDLEWVRSDNHGGARLAVGHLLSCGYRRIACITSLIQPQFAERYEGYVATMREAGLEPWLVGIEEGYTREEQGRRATAALVEAGQSFDAIFAACDEMALGAMRALRDAGIDVPGDVGVIGFDGIRTGAQATPPLTTIEADFEAAGDLLVDRLLGMVTGNPAPQVRVPIALRARASTRGAR
ncbi:MAG: substrate-binding domain-containing protein [Sphingomonadales bacterium]|nr:substrate-binding domain-containing protein [Sphingomonadales bacterium]